MALNTRWFDYDGCNWFAAGPDDGSARSAVYAATVQQGHGLPLIYTLECNYDSGVAANPLKARHVASRDGARGMSPEPPPLRNTMGPKYTPEAWSDIGKAIALAMLDWCSGNPASRLGVPGDDSLQQLRKDVAKALAKRETSKAAPRRAPREDDSAGEEETGAETDGEPEAPAEEAAALSLS